MPIGPEKLLEIFQQELKNITPQYDGYTKALEKELVDIFNLEAQNLITRFNIQQQINEKCQVLGELLSKHGDTDKT